MLLGLLLLNTSSVNELILIILLWIIPSSLVWWLGTLLEFNLENLEHKND